MTHLRRKSRITILLLAFLFISITLSQGQQRSLWVGAGISPMHTSAQSDFQAFQMPYSLLIQYQRGKMGVRLDHQWHGEYIKENFSANLKSAELSLTYDISSLLNVSNIRGEIRMGAAAWETVFTTEGYPGITDYVLKIEEDRGIGLVAGAGIYYDLSFCLLGVELQYAKHGTAQFIAGGFEPQPFLSDQIRVMVTAKYQLPIFNSWGATIPCPQF